MSHQFSVQDLPLRADLWIRRGNYLHAKLTAKQASGDDVSWFGYTATLVTPTGVPAGTAVLDPALVGNAGAGDIDLEINTQGEGSDARGPWSLTVVQGGYETTLWQGRLIMEEKEATRLRMQDGCGLEIDSDCGEPIVVYVPAQGIQGAQGAPGVGGADIRSGRIGVGSFAGDPLSAAVAFSSDMSDNDYSVTLGLEAPGPRQIPVSADNRTASGFDLVLGSQDIAGIVAVNWLAIPTV